MSALLYLIPAALFLGLLGLLAFLWSIRSGQFDDMDGAASRILFDDEEKRRDSHNAATQGDADSKNASIQSDDQPERESRKGTD